MIASGTAAPAPTGTATPSAGATPSAAPPPSAKPSASAAPSGSSSPQGWAPAPTSAAAPTATAPARRRPAGRRLDPGHPAGRRRPEAVPGGGRGVPVAHLRRQRPRPAPRAWTSRATTSRPATRTAPTKYLLGPAIIEGTQIGGASVVAPDTTNASWRVSLDFKGQGQAIWAEYTAKHNVTVTPNDPANRVAFVLDGKTISAPEIQGTINGQTEVTGQFTQESATDLANVLKYGALPLTFEQQEALTISPTLGTDQLKAGLLAGGIGIALVFIYACSTTGRSAWS